MMRARVLTAAVLGGCAAGGIAAALQPSAIGDPADPAYRGPSVPLTIDRSAPGPLPTDRPSFVVEPGSSRLTARRADPAGGPDWAVRVYRARAAVPVALSGSARRRRMVPQGPPRNCAQLVRIYGGQPGWIDGGNRFHRVRGESMSEAPQTCDFRIRGRGRAQLITATLVESPTSSTPRALGNVLWSFGAPTLHGARLTVDGRRVELGPAGLQGTSISFTGPRRDLTTARLQVRREDGRAGRIDAINARGYGFTAARPVAPERRVIPGTARILARSADPGGGAPWGIISARIPRGRWCGAIAGQIVGRQVGRIDPVLGTFEPVSPGIPGNRCAAGYLGVPLRGRAVALFPGTGSFGDPMAPQGELGDALRRQPGRKVIVGSARADVRSVTVDNGASVRTVEPGPVAGAFVLVSDTGPQWLMSFGDLSRTRLTIRLKDGRTIERTVSAPGL